MTARVVEASGAQVLPSIGDGRAKVTGWQAQLCVDADLRAKAPQIAALAGRLYLEAENAA